MSDKNPRAACPYFHSAYNALLRCGDPARVQILTRFKRMSRKRMYIRKSCCDPGGWQDCPKARLLQELEKKGIDTGHEPPS